MFKPSKLNLLLLLEGLASTSIQMIVLRQVTPKVGMSLLVTSIVVSSFLAALAAGYYAGGQVAKRDYKNQLRSNLFVALILFSITLSYVFVSLFFDQARVLTSGIPVLGNVLVHLSVFCLFFMCPLVFKLGQTIPLVLNGAFEEAGKSEATGNVTALSTIGNVFGILLSSLILMYFMGVGYTVFINCVLLCVCILFLIDKNREGIVYTVITVSMMGFCWLLNITLSERFFIKTNAYSNIRVFEHENGRVMSINSSFSSYLDKDDRSGWPYIEIMKSVIGKASDENTHILVLGSAGYSLTADKSLKGQFTYVDIDPDIATIAQEHFLQEPAIGTQVTQDARLYLLNNTKKWDFIVLDMYSNAAKIPVHTSTFEFYDLVNSRLKPNGRVLMNVAYNPEHRTNYALRIDTTIRSAFGICLTDLDGYKNAISNVVYICRPKSFMNQTHLTEYRDENTQVDIDSYISTSTLTFYNE